MNPFQPKNPNKAYLSSPCIGHCCLDNNDICLGCFRSLEEITQWTLVDERTRQNFLAIAKDRAEQHQQSISEK